MTGWLRRAGRGRLPDGSVVTWSVAEGTRGRRCRWTVAVGDRLQIAGLVELDEQGRLARLEIGTAAGQLTLHPEGAGSMLGNVVTHEGVQPIALAWDLRWGIGLPDDPFGSALCAWTGAGLVIEPSLAWWTGAADIETLAVDDRGLPLLQGATEWPLEE